MRPISIKRMTKKANEKCGAKRPNHSLPRRLRRVGDRGSWMRGELQARLYDVHGQG
jgi:hypothetical protein